jgi:RNA polymerase sigma-70 factor, ECF subfamily
MSGVTPGDSRPTAPQKPIEQLLGELRPGLHRYCARMTGSVIDGEDVVQECMLKAIEAVAAAGPIANPEGWLFRIAHNAALDFLRRRAGEQQRQSAEELDVIMSERNPVEERQIVAATLRTCMRAAGAKRSSVILSDVLGYSLQEISEIVGGSVPAARAALQRGRNRLRALATEPDDVPTPVLAEPERTRLKNLRRALQCARLRCGARLAGRGRAPRAGQPYAPRREKERRTLFRQL